MIISAMAAEYLTTAEAAKALRLGKSTLAAWAHDGKVRPAYVTRGGHYRWDIDDLRRQLEIDLPEK